MSLKSTKFSTGFICSVGVTGSVAFGVVYVGPCVRAGVPAGPAISGSVRRFQSQ